MKNFARIWFFFAVIGQSLLTTPFETLGSSENKCTCGKRFEGKIVGGNDAEANEWPWIAALCYYSPCSRDSHFCGGTLINDLYVMTAAHCVAAVTETDVVVSLGDHDLNIPSEEGSSEFSVAKIIRHEDYDSVTERNDIALLRLTEKVTFSETVIPICLPPFWRLYLFKTAYVIGWGSLDYYNPEFATILQEVSVPVITNVECRRKYGREMITNQMICAGETGVDSCQGDSGGPLMYKNFANTYEQIGIVSFGSGCGGEYPGVYTRVNRYLKWIDQKTEDATYCKPSSSLIIF